MKIFNIEITKNKIIIFAAVVIFISLAVFFFYPRSLADICRCPSRYERIDITEEQFGYSIEEDDVICLYTDDARKLIEATENTKVYRSPFYKKLDEVGSDGINLYIHFKTQGHVMKTPLKIHVLTEDILVIDGVQYGVYGSEFIETLDSLIK